MTLRDNIDDFVYAQSKPILHYIKKEDLEKYFKFTFVRNPWDRMVSLFYFISNRNGTISRFLNLPADRYYHSKYNGDFNLFMKDFAKGFVPYQHLFKPQYYITTKNLDLFDFIGRFENLQEDYNHVCSLCGIQRHDLFHYNKSKHLMYKELYNDFSKKIVERIYKKDIELFDYDF